MKPSIMFDVHTAMRHFSAIAASVPAIALMLGACSSETKPNASDVVVTNEGIVANEAIVDVTSGATHNIANVSAPEAGSATSKNILGLEGLGTLKIGQPVPKGSSWAERGAQTSDECRTVSSPDYPGVYAIVAADKVRRITVGQRSDVKLVEGVGVGTSEKDVKKWFAGFREEPHKYVEAPAKYLTAPGAEGGSSALRFEIGKDGKVSMMHVGTMPVLGYVEGCA